jgi:hypothetical protein
MSRGSQSWCRRWYGDPDSPGYIERNTVVFDFCGRPMRVHRLALRHFKHLERLFREKATRYARAINDGTLDDWSYANRNIAGTSVKSTHAFGIAIDINAIDNARGSSGNMPDQVVRWWVISGGVWGGSWSYPDAMHFQTNLRPAEIWARFDRYGRYRTDAIRRRLRRHR